LHRCYNVVMIRVNIAEAKAGFSRLLRAVRSGEAVVICDHNVPVAELRALPAANRQKRKLGPGRPGFEIPASFFEPLPDDLAGAFAGEDV
jgi:antitoxin (DNA-binding transcriptional repressor) of toxin-antitoxin stability system